jgi:hypothetical protein
MAKTQGLKEFKDKRVLIFQQRGWGMKVGHLLAKKLQAEGCRLAALTMKKLVYDHAKAQKDVKYEFIYSYDHIIEDPQKYLGDDDYTLQEICDDLGIDSVWPFVQSLRHYVKSYAKKYYFSYRQEKSDEEIILYIKAAYKHIKDVWKNFNPELIIAPNTIYLFHIFYSLYAKKFNVKTLRVIESRVRGTCIIVYDYNESGGRFYDRFQELENGAKSDNFDKAKEYIKKSSEKLITPIYSDNTLKKLPLIKRIRYHLAPYRAIVRYYLRPDQTNILKNQRATLDHVPPRYILRNYFAHTRNVRLSNKFKYYDFEKVNKFIYFPLQYQPEETIDVMAPHFNNQLETLRQVAMSAPNDYTVVVKEHPIMVGSRTISYMEKITLTPNVKFIDYRIPSEKVIRRADLVVNVSGTTLAEAAFLKKPAIQLGNLAATKLLPNVFTHSDFTTMAAKIKEILKIDLNTEEYDRKLLNFVTAIYDVGLELDFIALWVASRPDKAGVTKLFELYKDEMRYIFNKSKK